MRFQTKLIIVNLAVLTVITAAVSTLVYQSQKAVLTRHAEEEVELIASNLARGLDRLLFERMADTRFLAGIPAFSSEPLDRNAVENHLTRLQKSHGYYSSTSLFNLKRVRLADSKGRKIGETHPYSEHWPAIEKGEEFVFVLDGSASDQGMVIYFAARVPSPQGEPRVVVSRVPLDSLLQATIRGIVPGRIDPVKSGTAKGGTMDGPLPDHQVAIVNSEGLLLYSSETPEKALDVSHEAWSRIQPLLARGVDVGTLLKDAGADNEGRILAFARDKGYRNFPGMGWTTVVSLPRQAALAEVMDLRNRLLILLGLISGLSVLAIGIFSRRVTRPLVEFTAAAAEVRRGNLEARAAVFSRDEFGQLATTFNAMVAELYRNRESLLDFNRELRRKVEEHTAALNASKRRLESELAERREAQEALADSHEYLDKIINSVADPIFVKNEQFHWILVNESFCQFTGHRCEDLIGKTDYDIFPAEEADVFRAIDREVFDAGRENVNEEQITTAAGVTLTIVTKKNLHTDRRGHRYIVGIFHDVTAETRARQELEESEERFRATAETAADALVLTDQQGRIIYWNPAAKRIFGYSEEEILEQTIDVCIPRLSRQAHQEGMQRVIETGRHSMVGKRVERMGRRRNGCEFPLELSVNSWVIKGERHFSAIIRDITDRKEAERALRESEERFRQIAENIREVFWMTTPGHTEQIYISPTYEEIWGRSRTSWYEDPDSWIDAVHPDDRQTVLEAAATRETSGLFDEQYRIVRPDGEIRWIHDRAYPIRDEQGEVYRIVGIAEDITERKHLEKDLQELLLQDELTGLYNRRGFMALAEQELKIAQRKGRELSLSFIDLDNMKWINDHLGHQAGDEALQKTSLLLTETFRESDIVARMGGDEFAVAAIDTNPEGAESQALRLKEKVKEMNAGGELPFVLSLSIGTATYVPDRPESLEKLLTRADHRMYQEKQRKKPQPMP